MSKLVVIVQCELVTRRCSGYNCMKAFTQRSGRMEGYPEGTRYMAINCGGCCGAGIDVKIENLEKRLLANEEPKAFTSLLNNNLRKSCTLVRQYRGSP